MNWKFRRDYRVITVGTTVATSVRHATYLLLLSVELFASFKAIPYTFSYFIIIVILYNCGIHLSSDRFSMSVRQVRTDPVEIGVAILVASSTVAVTCKITRRHNCQRTDDRSLTV